MAVTEDRVFHYVKRGDSARIPRRHIFLDTESVSERTRTGRRQRWRVGVAAHRIAEKNRPVRESLAVHDDPESLWRSVSEVTRGRNRTVLWAHNLGYDVRIADAFTVLPALGWRCIQHNLANRGTWLHWKRGEATLLMVDSQAVFPVPLQTLAIARGVSKIQLPGEDDDRALWVARCTRDVEILRDAMVDYLAWLEAENLGSWQLTGAGQSYAAFRSRFLTHSMLVHADVDALSAERRAMWTGRCEAYWRGRTGRVGVEEWDLSLAYARIARDSYVPTRFIGEIDPRTDLKGLLGRRCYAVLADVEIETSVPVAPCKVDGRVAWPVGSFRTTLWGPELALALEVGATVQPSRIWLYQATPALKQWAEWIIDGLESKDGTIPGWLYIVLKHWARALIGRFGMQYTEWLSYGVTSDLRLLHSDVYDTTTGETYSLSHVGHNVFRQGEEIEWGQSQPAITGWVMSAARVWLWRLLEAMGPRAVLYADTDSFYTTGEHHETARQLAASKLGDGLRLKATHRGAVILGPRQVITDSKPRIAGLPSRAEQLPDGTFAGEIWTSLQAGLRKGITDTVPTHDRKWTIKGVDHRRAPGADGWTVPIRVEGGVIVAAPESDVAVPADKGARKVPKPRVRKVVAPKGRP